MTFESLHYLEVYIYQKDYSLIWINVGAKWFRLEQFELKEPKRHWQTCQKSYRLFCYGGVSGNNLPLVVV